MYARVLVPEEALIQVKGRSLVASVTLLWIGRGVAMQASVRRYSAMRRRSLIAMVARRAVLNFNGSASTVLVKPFVVLAARVLGPGPTRLRLVKLAHTLGPNGAVAKTSRGGYDEDEAAVHTGKRAA